MEQLVFKNRPDHYFISSSVEGPNITIFAYLSRTPGFYYKSFEKVSLQPTLDTIVEPTICLKVKKLAPVPFLSSKDNRPITNIKKYLPAQ